MPFNRKEWQQNNKEKIKECNKEYREKNKERIQEWREEHKEQRKEYDKEYREENKEKIKERKKEYYKENKERIQEQKKEYLKTDQSKKSHRISTWKQLGLISEDYDKLYELYINTNECDNCGIELVEGRYGSNKRCMDHNHRTGLFRNILCHNCNSIRPDYESD